MRDAIPHRGASDVSHLRKTLSVAEWEVLRIDAEYFGAELVFAAATGGLAEYENHPEHGVWAAVSEGSSRLQLLRARVRAAGSVRARTLLLATATLPNQDHLRMALQREPQLSDYVKELSGRIREALSALWGWLKHTRRNP